ncbi:hypothetical protein GBA52_013789 [Prunus armeniaca]|nr:hypothetical protein GBA52_013789 [Prunus armeniaca]
MVAYSAHHSTTSAAGAGERDPRTQMERRNLKALSAVGGGRRGDFTLSSRAIRKHKRDRSRSTRLHPNQIPKYKSLVVVGFKRGFVFSVCSC